MSDNATLSISMRPQKFADVIGLENEVGVLLKKIDSGDIPRGFLLTGPFGCGKTTLAWLIARAVQGWDFDGEPQVMEINGANARKIEDMRVMADKAGAYPMVGKYSIIILDEVHQLTKEAQQILLKELEAKQSPTVWILATTDPQKLNPGVQERCFKLTVRGMGEPERAALVARAVKATNHAGDVSDFLAALTKQKLTGPRKILQAFGLYHNGMPAVAAVAQQAFEYTSDYFTVAQGVVYGKWNSKYSLFGKDHASVAEQIKAIDAALSKKPKDMLEEKPDPAAKDEPEVVDEEDVVVASKPEAARALRAITAASLKSIVLKGNANSMKAAEALYILAHCVSPNPFDTGLEWAATIGGLYRVHQKLYSK